MLRLIFVLNFAILGVLSAAPKCKISDKACTLKVAKQLYKNLFETENNKLDPMYHEIIEGNLSILKFKLKETTIKGLKECSIESFNLDLEKQTTEYELLCPYFSISGKYDIQGHLIILPVEGNGEYNINTKSYRLKIRSNINLIPENENKHLHIKNFQVDGEALEGVVYDFKNLFNGQKDLTDAVLKFANENWKEVTNEFQGPVFNAVIRKVHQETNRILEVKSFNDYIDI